MSDPVLESERRMLVRSLRELGRIAVAFSGGVDSTLLLRAAREAVGEDAFAITVRTPFSPAEDLADAIAFCEEAAIMQHVIDLDVLQDPRIVANTSERCYLCKRSILQAVRERAAHEGAIVVEGTNADDANDFRPGERALAELGIRSPLREAGLTKADVRALSRAYGLPTSERPANACLATRIPTDTPLERAALERADAAERLLHAEGFVGCRVRIHGDLARIELAPADIERAAAEPLRSRIIDGFGRIGFRYVSLDLSGYRMGNMN